MLIIKKQFARYIHGEYSDFKEEFLYTNGILSGPEYNRPNEFEF
jgi:hypothetical protein